ncbi:alpha-amylase family glycosyl hydrolase [Chlorobaculum sp. 24CR]|uniref:alpha-amylase family glycosyl hydrolase n=1 Tax=Chlorobaculum sp. 24CR TaxID=2508878 RepID=UPI001430F00C|nr:alpha-amylase family glycosyl hydrolase [Chlorobaculum sp. 24CR]
MTIHSLDLLIASLEKARRESTSPGYAVPNLWRNGATGISVVDPFDYFSETLDAIGNAPPAKLDAGPEESGWSASAIVYNLFVRYDAAFDHNRDGQIGTDALAEGFRETGTLLKAITMLPYIRRMGVNTLYLLPLTSIGSVNRKGSLGSPYAIKNQYRLDETLGEPALDLSLETQLKALVEAAHHLGMRVVFEFVFRTSSIDSDWIEQHPKWFYWIKSSEGLPPYAAPAFEDDKLTRIYEQVDKHDFHELPEPDEAYRNRFVPAPEKLALGEHGYSGATADGEPCVIASAFSDWPPDDRQPPWTDVTYLKLHDSPRFNYIAYNTIRMYDEALERPEFRASALWREITGIIPWYREQFGIDGAMIDMGHALPPELKASIVAEARRAAPEFAFWDENFDPSPKLKEEGFNAVFGSLPFVIHDVLFIKGLLNFLNRNGVAIPFFATGENHNTPRVCHNLAGKEAGRRRALFLFTLGAVLPAMPFIHSGMEICEWQPVNLGLNFTDDDRERFPAESLPLFAPASCDWAESNGLEPLCDDIRKVLAIRSRYFELVRCGDKGSITQPYISETQLLTVMRKSGGRNLVFAGNSNFEEPVTGTMEFGQQEMELEELISGRTLTVTDHKLVIDFAPGQCVLFELPDTTEEQC